MNDRSSAPLFVGGAVVVALSGLAGFLGSRLGRGSETPTSPVEPVSAEPSSSALEALERRLGYVERRLDLLEMREPPVASPEGTSPVKPAEHAVAATPAQPGDAASAPAAPAKTPEEQLKDLTRRSGRGLADFFARTLSDTSVKGGEDRLAQAVVEAASVERQFHVSAEPTRDEIRRIFEDQWEANARDVGPLVREGLDKADIAVVRDRLRDSWTETDRRMKPLFDEATWKQYVSEIGMRRASLVQTLDEIESERLGRPK